jgi:hypothetical protein
MYRFLENVRPRTRTTSDAAHARSTTEASDRLAPGHGTLSATSFAAAAMACSIVRRVVTRRFGLDASFPVCP